MEKKNDVEVFVDEDDHQGNTGIVKEKLTQVRGQVTSGASNQQMIQASPPVTQHKQQTQMMASPVSSPSRSVRLLRLQQGQGANGTSSKLEELRRRRAEAQKRLEERRAGLLSPGSSGLSRSGMVSPGSSLLSPGSSLLSPGSFLSPTGTPRAVAITSNQTEPAPLLPTINRRTNFLNTSGQDVATILDQGDDTYVGARKTTRTTTTPKQSMIPRPKTGRSSSTATAGTAGTLGSDRTDKTEPKVVLAPHLTHLRQNEGKEASSCEPTTDSPATTAVSPSYQVHSNSRLGLVVTTGSEPEAREPAVETIAKDSKAEAAIVAASVTAGATAGATAVAGVTAAKQQPQTVSEFQNEYDDNDDEEEEEDGEDDDERDEEEDDLFDFLGDDETNRVEFSDVEFNNNTNTQRGLKRTKSSSVVASAVSAVSGVSAVSAWSSWSVWSTRGFKSEDICCCCPKQFYWPDMILFVNYGLLFAFLLVAGGSGAGFSSNDILMISIAGTLAGAFAVCALQCVEANKRSQRIGREALLELNSKKQKDETRAGQRKEVELVERDLPIFTRGQDIENGADDGDDDDYTDVTQRRSNSLLNLIGIPKEDPLHQQLLRYYRSHPDEREKLQVCSSLLDEQVARQRSSNPIKVGLLAFVLFLVGALVSVIPFTFQHEDPLVPLIVAAVLTAIALLVVSVISIDDAQGEKKNCCLAAVMGENLLIAGIGGILAYGAGLLVNLVLGD